MASAITHIVLADKVYNKYFSDKKKNEFFIGTVLPDIRYLGVVKREETHEQDLSLADIQKCDSFEAGFRFHSLVDIIGNEYFVKNKMYDLCPKNQAALRALKGIQDKIYYPKIKNWQEYIGYLDTILPQEKKYNITEKDLKNWHLVLQNYFAIAPDQQSRANFMKGLTLPDDMITKINKATKLLKGNEKINQIFENFYNDFESLLSK